MSTNHPSRSPDAEGRDTETPTDAVETLGPRHARPGGAGRERARSAAESKADDRPASEAAQREQDHQLDTGEEPPA